MRREALKPAPHPDSRIELTQNLGEARGIRPRLASLRPVQAMALRHAHAGEGVDAKWTNGVLQVCARCKGPRLEYCDAVDAAAAVGVCAGDSDDCCSWRWRRQRRRRH